MATFLEMLQGAGNNLNAGFNSPWTQLGLQMLQASGQMQGDPSFAQRFGAAGQGFLKQQQESAEQQQQQLLRQIQLGQLAKQVQGQDSEEKRRKMLIDAVKNNPDILSNSPLARAVLEATGDVSGIADIAKIGQPTAPKVPYTYEENLPTGERQQYIWDQATGTHRATAPYWPPQQQAIDQRGQQFEQTMGFKQQQAGTAQSQWEQEQAVREQQAGTAAQRAQAQVDAELRKGEKAVRERKVDQINLQSQYRVADQRFGEVEQRIQTLLQHPGLRGNYGLYGKLGNIPGAEAANARVLINELREMLSFTELNRLKQMGVNLAPITEAERDAAGKSFANLENAQDFESVQNQLNKALSMVQRSRQEASTLFGQLDLLYGQPAPQQQQQGGGGQVAAPKSRADYDALPSGAIYIDPATGRQARKR